MANKSKVTSPQSVELVFMPNAEKIAEAKRIAAPGYRRALIKKLKEQRTEEDKSPA